METKEIARRVFGLLEKVVLTAFFLAWIGLWIFMIVEMDPTPFWLEVLVMISLAWKVFMLMEIWEAE